MLRPSFLSVLTFSRKAFSTHSRCCSPSQRQPDVVCALPRKRSLNAGENREEPYTPVFIFFTQHPIIPLIKQHSNFLLRNRNHFLLIASCVVFWRGVGEEGAHPDSKFQLCLRSECLCPPQSFMLKPNPQCDGGKQ